MARTSRRGAMVTALPRRQGTRMHRMAETFRQALHSISDERRIINPKCLFQPSFLVFLSLASISDEPYNEEGELEALD